VSAIRILRERDQAERARAEAVRRVDELTVEKAMVDLGRDPPAALQLVAGLSRGSAMWPAARIVLGAALEVGVSREVGHEPMADVTGFRMLEGGQLLVASRRQLAVWDTARGARRAIPADEVLGLGFHGHHALVRRGADLVIVALPGGAASRLGAAPPGTRLGAIRDDGRLVAIATGDATSLWEPGGAPHPLGPAPTGKVLAFSPTGDYLLTFTDMDLPDGRAVPEGIAMGAGIWTLPDGTWKQVSKWDFVDGEFLVQSPDGSKAGTLSREKMLFILGARDATFSAYVLPGFGNKIAAARVAAFSPDSKLYVMGDSDHYVRLVGRDVPTQIFTQRDAEVTDVGWLPDGSGVLAASRDATVVLFKLKRPYYSTFTFPRPVLRVAVAGDGRSLAVLLDDGAIRELPLPVDDEHQWEQPAMLAALAGDGTAAVVATAQPDEVRLVAGNGEARALGRCGAPVTALAAAPGAVAALCAGSVALWRAGVMSRVPIQAAGAIALSRRGDLLTWSEDGVVRAWSARGAARSVAVALPAGSLLAVTPDGAHAVAASGSDLVWIEIASGAVSRQPAGRDPIVSLAIAPDGSRAAAGHSDNEIALHRRNGGTPRTLRRHTVPPRALAFSPDGASLLSGAGNATVLDWDLASEVNRFVAGHWTPLLAVGFDPDGAIHTISEKLSRRTTDDLPHSEEGMRAWIARALRSPSGATAPPPAPAR
jgi:WD40 repeat protein